MKAFAKANIFLKLVGFDERLYHRLHSRFVLIHTLFDELFLSKEKKKAGFELQSEFECEDNIIIKAYHLLRKNGFAHALDECFQTHSLVLEKNIPLCAGLGGGSSDAACFLLLMNEELNLQIPKDKLMQMGFALGSDVPFFLSGFYSANVSGTGEIVAEFDDEVPPLCFTFPQIQCSTALVYKEFDNTPFDFKKNLTMAEQFSHLTSKELLEYKNTLLNDLFTPCVNLYPKMSAFLEQNFFLSGSGSSVYKVGE